MTPVYVLLLVAGLSEAAGRVLPLVSSRPGMSRPVVGSLLLSGALIECVVIALWPVTAWTLAGLVHPELPATGTGLVWTTELIAPLVLAGVLALPWLGPLLHALLLTAVGATLTAPLAAATGLAWVAAAGCVAVAALGLECAVAVVRNLVSRALAIGVGGVSG
ncbi:hypothetical protein [Kribbella sp. NPDC000426]|uniref:hypothetical protein n=1 Tax=Kribbella sp. NPDC000426 TaxID=3154255 RepID=UPI0033293449